MQQEAKTKEIEEKSLAFSSFRSLRSRRRVERVSSDTTSHAVARGEQGGDCSNEMGLPSSLFLLFHRRFDRNDSSRFCDQSYVTRSGFLARDKPLYSRRVFFGLVTRLVHLPVAIPKKNPTRDNLFYPSSFLVKFTECNVKI